MNLVLLVMLPRQRKVKRMMKLKIFSRQVVKEALGSSRGHVRDYMLYIGALDSILS
ncbi:hypothetical protein HN51_054047, partial [Arachis hypogaea]